MQHFLNVSAQRVSWVKSNKDELEKHKNAIRNLFYPETTNEFRDLVLGFYKSGVHFDLIGYSSNTLFLPSYSTENLICTKKILSWYETDNEIICDCGVNVAKLSKEMVQKGYEGFSGLTDLPGTIASSVYGNCGCYNCSINELLKYIIFLTPAGEILHITKEELKLAFRTSALKRKEIEGVILQVVLFKFKGVPDVEIKKAELAHKERINTQPSAVNNLGSTINASMLTLKGQIICIFIRIISRLFPKLDSSKVYKYIYYIIGAAKYVKYLDVWNRYMFYDIKSHKLLFSYLEFFRTIYKDARLEIEIKR